MGGRPRTPTQVLEDKGAFAKDPQRRASRKDEPKPNGPIGAPPDYFDDNHREVWQELVDEAPRGVLAKSDRKQLELTTRLTCKMRVVPGRMHKALRFLGDALLNLGMNEKDVEDFKEDMRKMVGCSSQDLSLLASCLTKMGMTPADRSKVHGESEEKPADPFDTVIAALTSPKRVQ